MEFLDTVRKFVQCVTPINRQTPLPVFIQHRLHRLISPPHHNRITFSSLADLQHLQLKEIKVTGASSTSNNGQTQTLGSHGYNKATQIDISSPPQPNNFYFSLADLQHLQLKDKEIKVTGAYSTSNNG